MSGSAPTSIPLAGVVCVVMKRLTSKVKGPHLLFLKVMWLQSFSLSPDLLSFTHPFLSLQVLHLQAVGMSSLGEGMVTERLSPASQPWEGPERGASRL